MPGFSQKSRLHLESCHPDLQRLFKAVVQEVDCSIICGFRSKPEQDLAFANKTSTKQWPDSKHNRIPSIAVDVVPYPCDWSDIESFKRLADVVKRKAKELKIGVRWGGDWPKFKDYPHYELTNG